MNRNSEIHQHSLRPDLLGARRSANSQRILGRLERNAGQRSRQLAVVSVGVFAAALLIGALVWLAWSNGSAPKGAGHSGSHVETGAHFGAAADGGAGLAAAGGAGPENGNALRADDGVAASDGGARLLHGAASDNGGARLMHGAASENGGARLLREQSAARSSQFETALSIAQVAAGVKASTQVVPADAARGTAQASQPGAPGAPLVRAPSTAPSVANGSAYGAVPGVAAPPAGARGPGTQSHAAGGSREPAAAYAGRAQGVDRLAVAPATKPAVAPKERSRSQASGTTSDNPAKARAAARGRTSLAAQTARQRAAQSAHAAEPQAASDTDPDVALISAIRQASRPAGN